MNNNLISVIVTVYNIEDYIKRCIESLQQQTWRELEIILVDDGSTDRSGVICDAAAAADARIRVLHKEHAGVSAARNAGLDAATGEYIGFVDGDDWVQPDMYHALHQACRDYQAQIAVCRYRKEGQNAQNEPFTNAVVPLDKLQILDIYVCGHEQYMVYPSVWSKLFHKDVVKGLQFAPGRESEDIMFSTEAFCRAQMCVYLDTPYYHYVTDRQGSIMNKRIGERRFAHEIPFWKEQSAYFYRQGLAELAEKSKYYFYRRMLFYYIEFKEQGYKEYEKRLARMMLDEKQAIRKVFKQEFAGTGDQARMKLFLLWPALYYYIVKIYDKVIIPLRTRKASPKSGRLLIYDTSNYQDFPIGGQLTSIINFLQYVIESRPERVRDILLVGITTVPEELGRLSSISMAGHNIAYLPVAVAETDLSHIQKSLRVRYMKGVLKYGRQLRISRRDCNYIQTPEVYGAVKIKNPLAKGVLFSHGSFFNMAKGFRFYRDNPVLLKCFQLYIKWIIRSARMIFTLDEDSSKAYRKYNKNLVRVDNSVVCPASRAKDHLTHQVIFVGRLSKGKNIEPIIDAVNSLKGLVTLTIVGDGEEYERLIKRKGEWVKFTGGVSPAEVQNFLKEADIMIMNSLFEGIPMVILEAISYGIPVITTDVGGIGSVLHYGKDSYRTDGTSQSIAAGIHAIYEDYENYSAQAFLGAKRFDYQAVNEAIVKQLEQYWR